MGCLGDLPPQVQSLVQAARTGTIPAVLPMTAVARVTGSKKDYSK
jgi:hypothetical protein